MEENVLGTLMNFTVEKVIKMIESGFDDVKEINRYEKDLVTIVSGGMHPEGSITPCYATSENDALRLLYAMYHSFRKWHPGTVLVWRVKPQVENIQAYSFSEGKRHRYEFHLMDIEYPVIVEADFAHQHSLYVAHMRLAIRNEV